MFLFHETLIPARRLHSLRRRILVDALVAISWALALSSSFSSAQDPASASNAVAQKSAADRNAATRSDRWLVVLCGLPGDQSHRERLTAATQQIAAAAESVLLVPREHVKLLVGDDQMVDELSDSSSAAEICSAERVRSLFQTLGSEISSGDSCWVIFLGHAQFLGTRSSFNVQGMDFDANDFARWLAPVQCRQRVFLLTMPVSGFWIKPLKGNQTVCIAATEAGLEFTATEMPYALADVLAGTQSHQGLEDIDQDGQLTLRDLYLAVNLEVFQRYKALERLQTEHAQIDDNGDGLGKELQETYLPKDATETELAENQPQVKVAQTLNADGDLARTIAVGKPAADQAAEKP